MKVIISKDAQLLGDAAARVAAEKLREAILEKGRANLLVSTGASQFTTLEALTQQKLDWEKVTMYHLDEYVGVDENHPASFCGYLKKRLLDVVAIRRAVLIDGTKEPYQTVAHLNQLMKTIAIDVGLIGIGENAHIAFNDPPADFLLEDAYHVVALNERCKQQQVGEGWFSSIEEVPKLAISMSCRQIMSCKTILCPVPFRVKADAIQKMFAAKKADNQVPATLLFQHPDCTLFLDEESASLAEIPKKE